MLLEAPMIEYAIVQKNRPISQKEEEMYKIAYQERSLLALEIKVNTYRFMEDEAILFYKDNGNNPQGPPVYIEDGKFTLLAGYLLSPSFKNDPDTITQQCHYQLNTPLKAQGAFGEFQVVHFDGEKVEVFCSKLMTHPVYYREEKGTKLVANRATLTNIAFEKVPTLNVKTQLEIIAFDSIFENKTAFEEVSCLDRGYHIRLEKEKELRKIKEEQLWADSSFEIKDMAQMYKDFKDYLDQYINKLSLLTKQMHLDEGMQFSISGGKDSRTLMTIFAEAGILKKFDYAFTYGEEDNPEVLAAKPVAKYFGMEHRSKPRSVPQNVYLQRLPHHIFQMEGEVNSRTLHGTYMNQRKMDFTGHEAALKEYFADSHLVEDEQGLKDFIDYRLPLDPIGFVKKEEREAMRKEIWGLYEKAHNDWQVPPENFPAFFSATGLGCRWGGKLTSASSVSGPYLNLLCAEDIIHFTFNMGPKNRKKELFHFFTIGHLAPRLLKHPFAFQTWNEEVQKAFANQFTIANEAIKGDVKRAYNWWDMIYQEDKGKKLIQLIEGTRHKSLDPYIDYPKLYKYIHATRASQGRELLSIFGLITANALFQGGDVTRESTQKLIDFLDDTTRKIDRNLISVPRERLSLGELLDVKNNNYLKEKVKRLLGR